MPCRANCHKLLHYSMTIPPIGKIGCGCLERTCPEAGQDEKQADNEKLLPDHFQWMFSRLRAAW
jgi:hypothetical protein